MPQRPHTNPLPPPPPQKLPRVAQNQPDYPPNLYGVVQSHPTSQPRLRGESYISPGTSTRPWYEQEGVVDAVKAWMLDKYQKAESATQGVEPSGPPPMPSYPHPELKQMTPEQLQAAYAVDPTGMTDKYMANLEADVAGIASTPSTIILRQPNQGPGAFISPKGQISTGMGNELLVSQPGEIKLAEHFNPGDVIHATIRLNPGNRLTPAALNYIDQLEGHPQSIIWELSDENSKVLGSGTSIPALKSILQQTLGKPTPPTSFSEVLGRPVTIPKVTEALRPTPAPPLPTMEASQLSEGTPKVTQPRYPDAISPEQPNILNRTIGPGAPVPGTKAASRISALSTKAEREEAARAAAKAREIAGPIVKPAALKPKKEEPIGNVPVKGAFDAVELEERRVLAQEKANEIAFLQYQLQMEQFAYMKEHGMMPSHAQAPPQPPTIPTTPEPTHAPTPAPKPATGKPKANKPSTSTTPPTEAWPDMTQEEADAIINQLADEGLPASEEPSGYVGMTVAQRDAARAAEAAQRAEAAKLSGKSRVTVPVIDKATGKPKTRKTLLTTPDPKTGKMVTREVEVPITKEERIERGPEAAPPVDISDFKTLSTLPYHEVDAFAFDKKGNKIPYKRKQLDNPPYVRVVRFAGRPYEAHLIGYVTDSDGVVRSYEFVGSKGDMFSVGAHMINTIHSPGPGEAPTLTKTITNKQIESFTPKSRVVSVHNPSEILELVGKTPRQDVESAIQGMKLRLEQMKSAVKELQAAGSRATGGELAAPSGKGKQVKEVSRAVRDLNDYLIRLGVREPGDSPSPVGTKAELKALNKSIGDLEKRIVEEVQKANADTEGKMMRVRNPITKQFQDLHPSEIRAVKDTGEVKPTTTLKATANAPEETVERPMRPEAKVSETTATREAETAERMASASPTAGAEPPALPGGASRSEVIADKYGFASLPPEKVYETRVATERAIPQAERRVTALSLTVSNYQKGLAKETAKGNKAAIEAFTKRLTAQQEALAKAQADHAELQARLSILREVEKTQRPPEPGIQGHEVPTEASIAMAAEKQSKDIGVKASEPAAPTPASGLDVSIRKIEDQITDYHARIKELDTKIDLLENPPAGLVRADVAATRAQRVKLKEERLGYEMTARSLTRKLAALKSRTPTATPPPPTPPPPGAAK